MKKTLIIIPTYDEKDNVGPISRAVLDLLPEVHLLFVDDNSPDGTGRWCDEVASARMTERCARVDDRHSEASMEDRKKQGYF